MLLVMGAVIVGAAWLIGMLTWQFLLFVAIGVNANEIHKWNHLPRKKRAKLVVALQDAGLLQSTKHHSKHHLGSKDTHYCVLTNVLNPLLDGVRFWHWLEWAILHFLGVSKRPSTEVRPVTRRVRLRRRRKPRRPLENLPHVRRLAGTKRFES